MRPHLYSTSGSIVPLRMIALVTVQALGGVFGVDPHLKSSVTSPHLTSPHLTSPHLTSPHLTSPHLTSPRRSVPSGFLVVFEKPNRSSFSCHVHVHVHLHFHLHITFDFLLPPCPDLFRRTRYDLSSFIVPSKTQHRWYALNNSTLYRQSILLVSWLYLGFSFLEAPAAAGSREYRTAIALNYLAALLLLFHSGTTLYWRYRLDGQLIRRYLLQFLIALLFLGDACAMAKWNYTTGGKAKSRMPLTSLLRPGMVLLQSRSTQRALYDIAAATWMSRQMLLFAMFVFVVSVVTGSALVGATHNPALEDRAASQGTGFGCVSLYRAVTM
jgi:hypothetical protein